MAQTSSSSTAPTPHPLRGKWFLFYQKYGVQESNHELMEGDFITTIEEAFSAIRALPDVTLLPQQDSIALSRNKVEPKFESFPKGYRVTMFARSKMQLDAITPRVLAAALGECILMEFEDKPEPRPEVQVIRLTHKPHKVYPESSSIDVWFSENPYMHEVEEYFKELVKSASGVGVTARVMDT